MLLKAKVALEGIDTFFWLDFGTLLGIYRDGKLISHDMDVDVGVFLKDYSPKIVDAMVKEGFVYEKKITIDEGQYGLEQSFAYKGVKIDIFYYTLEDESCYCHLFPLDKQRNQLVREVYHTFTGFKKIEFLGKYWNIPKDTDLRLRETYGKDYRIPVVNWYTPNDALNSRIINKDCNEIKYS